MCCLGVMTIEIPMNIWPPRFKHIILYLCVIKATGPVGGGHADLTGIEILEKSQHISCTLHRNGNSTPERYAVQYCTVLQCFCCQVCIGGNPSFYGQCPQKM